MLIYGKNIINYNNTWQDLTRSRHLKLNITAYFDDFNADFSATLDRKPPQLWLRWIHPNDPANVLSPGDVVWARHEVVFGQVPRGANVGEWKSSINPRSELSWIDMNWSRIGRIGPNFEFKFCHYECESPLPSAAQAWRGQPKDDRHTRIHQNCSTACFPLGRRSPCKKYGTVMYS